MFPGIMPLWIAGIGPQELLIIFFIVLLLFGAGRIPEVARAMGKGIRDFKRATKDLEDDLNIRDDPPSRRLSGDPPRTASSERERERTETPPR